MIGTGELILIFFVILLLFGGKKLPELAKSLGKGISEFKRGCQEGECCGGKCEISKDENKE